MGHVCIVKYVKYISALSVIEIIYGSLNAGVIKIIFGSLNADNKNLSNMHILLNNNAYCIVIFVVKI